MLLPSNNLCATTSSSGFSFVIQLVAIRNYCENGKE